MLAKEEKKDLIVDEPLHRYSSYWKQLRVTAYVKRFVSNCKKKKQNRETERTTEDRRIASSREFLDYLGTSGSSSKIRCKP